jgi:hypothetical protein
MLSVFSSAADCAATQSKPENHGTAAGVHKQEVVILILWLVACSAAVFWRTFRLPYAFDDLDHLHALATLRSGQISFISWFFLNHNEHIVPLLRLYFLAATRIGGLNALPLHIMVFLTYVAGAVGCAWIFFSLTQSRFGAWLAGTIYASAGGFAGSTVWQPTIAQFSISGTPLLFAMALLLSPYARKPWSMVAMFGLVLVAAMGMGASAVAALAIPIYLYLAKPESIAAGKRKIIIAFSLLLSVLILLAARRILTLNGISQVLTFTWAGVSAGLFLIFVTPGRFLLAWVPAGELGLKVDVAASLLGWILLIISLRWVKKPMRLLLLSLWIADCLLTMLIGIGRYQDWYLPLFVTDRYYFFFLLPLALQTAAVVETMTARLLAGVSRFRRIGVACVLSGGLVALLAAAHSRLDRCIPWDILKVHQSGLREVNLLAKILARRAAAQNLHLADGPLFVPGVHKEHIALACVVFTKFPRGLPGIQWTFSRIPPTNVKSLWIQSGQGWYLGSPWNVPAISEADAAVENQILDEWARIEKRPPYSCMIGGKMQDIADPTVRSCAEAAKASGTAGVKLP